MAKRKDTDYKWARDLLYCKDTYLRNYVDDMLIKCNQIFHYDGLPKTLPKEVLERFLFENGECIIAEHGGNLYAFTGGAGGIPDVYNRPTEYTVANPALNLNKVFKIDGDCVLVANDSGRRGLIPTLSRYAVLCCDAEISINMITNVLRAQYMIAAGDNRTIESAKKFIDKLYAGDFAAISENAFLDGVKVHTVNNGHNYIQQFIELNQYLRATAYNEIGLEANYNMKREALHTEEIMLNASILMPLVDDMLEARREAMQKVNAMFGTEISVDLASVWKNQKEALDKSTETAETETHIDSDYERAAAEAEIDGVEAEAAAEAERAAEETEQEAEKSEETEREAETQTETEAETQTETEAEKADEKPADTEKVKEIVEELIDELKGGEKK